MIFVVYDYMDNDVRITTNPKIAHSFFLKITLGCGKRRTVSIDVFNEDGNKIAWAEFLDGKLIDEWSES